MPVFFPSRFQELFFEKSTRNIEKRPKTEKYQQKSWGGSVTNSLRETTIEPEEEISTLAELF